MKHFLTAVCCGALLPFVWWRERHSKEDQELFAEWLAWRAALTLPRPRFEDNLIVATAHGSAHGFCVRASCDAEAAEILTVLPTLRVAP